MKLFQSIGSMLVKKCIVEEGPTGRDDLGVEAEVVRGTDCPVGVDIASGCMQMAVG